MEVLRTREQVRSSIAERRSGGQTIGFVPTMGALHEGHVSLIRASASEYDYAVVSIFVNPTQFGPNEDFERYPRMLSRDLSIAEEAGAHLVYAPAVQDLYSSRFKTLVEVKELGEVLCGAARPGHFRGVATIVAKLLNIVRPDAIYLGRKDAQQAIVLRQMVDDLDFDVLVRVMPTVREADGLAMSSRNKYLTEAGRAVASKLFASLSAAGELFKEGVRDAEQLKAAALSVLDMEKNIDIEYLETRDAENLKAVSRVEGRTLLAIAARIDGTRCIDNVVLDPANKTFEA